MYCVRSVCDQRGVLCRECWHSFKLVDTEVVKIDVVGLVLWRSFAIMAFVRHTTVRGRFIIDGVVIMLVESYVRALYLEPLFVLCFDDPSRALGVDSVDSDSGAIEVFTRL